MDTIENEILAEVQVDAGYYDSDHLTFPVGAMAPGSQNVFLLNNRSQRTFRGLLPAGTGGRTMFNVAGGYASLNDSGATQGKGSIFNYINESLFAIGAGDIYYNGTTIGVSAASTLKLAPKSGGYHYPAWFTAGLSQPTAPQVFAKAPGLGFIGLLSGLFSIKIAQVRGITGARSIASVTSAVITCTSQTIRITFPALATNGADRWAIFSTKAGFGGTGVHYLVTEIADTALSIIDGVPRSYELEFNDGDLLPVAAYIDDYPPQAGLFAARLENYVLIIGCYDNAIAASLRNIPESFNPDHLGFLPKTPTAVLADPQGSYLYVSTDSSVHAVSVIPSTDNPLVIQTIWSDIGVSHSHNWCSVEGVVFAFTSKAGAVTMNMMGQPTNVFALPVSRAMKDWAVEDTVVFRVPHLNMVCYGNGSTTYGYNTQTGLWSSPAMLNAYSGSIVSAVVKDRKPYVTLNNGGTFTAYEFDNGIDPMTAIVQTPFIISPEGNRMNLLGVRTKFCAPHTGTYLTDLLTDYSATPAKTLSHLVLLTGMTETEAARWYLPRVESFAVKFTGTQTDFSRDMYVSKFSLFGTAEQSNLLNAVTSLTITDDALVPITDGGAAITWAG